MNHKLFNSATATCMIVLAFSIFNSLAAQEKSIKESDIIRVKYTILDKTSKKYSSFFGTRSGEISFHLVEFKNLDTEEALLGVEVSIQAKETEQTSSSMAFSSIGSLWGVSSSATYVNIRKSGYLFLNEEELTEVINFLNRILGAVGQAQDKYVQYSISIGHYFEFGMLYDPSTFPENRWGFTFTVEEATYKLNYADGIAVLRSLNSFREYILANQTN